MHAFGVQHTFAFRMVGFEPAAVCSQSKHTTKQLSASAKKIKKKDGPADAEDFLLKIKIVDWFSVEYTSLVQTCRAYNIEMPEKASMHEYKQCITIKAASRRYKLLSPKAASHKRLRP